MKKQWTAVIQQQNDQHTSRFPESLLSNQQFYQGIATAILFFSLILLTMITSISIYIQTKAQNINSFSYNLNRFDLKDTCDTLQQNYHHVSPQKVGQNPKVYYRTNYGLFLPSCKQIQRLDIKNWGKQRQIIQWAKVNVFQQDQVLYDCPDTKNYLQLLVLSMLVGPEGKIYSSAQYNNECMNDIKQLYGAFNNIYLASSSKIPYSQFQIIISTNQPEIHTFLQRQDLSYQNPSLFLFRLAEIYQSSRNKLIMKINQNQLAFSGISIDNENCSSNVKLTQITKESHFQKYPSKFYQIKTKSYKIKFPLIFTLQQNFEKYKTRKNEIQYKKKIQKSIKNNFLKYQNLLIQQFNDRQRNNNTQIIQWVKIKSQQNSTILFYYNCKEINLFIVFNIAILIPKGKLILNCSSRHKQIIEQKAKKLNIINIHYYETLKATQQFTGRYLAITDDPQYISELTNINQDDGFDLHLLAYFKPIQQSRNFLYRIYTRYHIRKVSNGTNSSGNIYQHFLPYSQNPHGFFDIQRQKHVIYVYWNNDVESLMKNTNRYQNLKEAIKINQPQVKVIHQKILPYFQLPYAKFHAGFYHLSPTHRSDYVRGYLMHHYGGGYMDIKHIQFDWQPYFEQLQNSPSHIYAIGYQQRSEGDVSCYEIEGKSPCQQIKKKYQQLIGNGQYIYKKKNLITKKWMSRMEQTLDRVYDQLKTIPQSYGANPNYRDIKKIPNYPLRWGQMGGSIIQRIQFEEPGHVYTNFPRVILADYQ